MYWRGRAKVPRLMHRRIRNRALERDVLGERDREGVCRRVRGLLCGGEEEGSFQLGGEEWRSLR